MNIKRHSILGLAMAISLEAGSAWASGISLLQSDQGTAGMAYDFGGVRLVPDQRGTTGMTYNYGAIQRYQFSDANGRMDTGTIYRLQPQAHPTLPVPSTPVTPLMPIVPYGGGLSPQSHSGGSHWRGGTGR
ncbi:MAG: hypothetical protein ACKOCD_06285 [Nitrospiraceae bacterium]